MSSPEEEEEEAASASGLPPPCAGCKHLRRKCVPGCAFAPYFPPDHGDQFAAVHSVFGASNVSKLLAELAPRDRAGAVESLVYEARARRLDPTFGCVSYITILQHVLRLARADVAAARGELAALAGAGAAACRPLEASPEARRAGEAQLDAVLRFAREQDDQMRAARLAFGAKQRQDRAEARKNAVRRGHWQPQASQQVAEAQVAAAAAQAGRDQAMKLQQAAAAPQQPRHRAVEQQAWTGQQGFPDGHPREQMAEASESAATREEAMMAQQAAAAQQHRHRAVAQNAATELGFPDGRVHGHPRHHTVRQMEMADAQKSVDADQAAREQQLMMVLRQAEEQQLGSAAAADVARKQDMMIRHALAATHKYRHPMDQYDQAMGHEQPRQNQQTEEAEMLATAQAASWEQETMMRASCQDEQYYHPHSRRHAHQLAAAEAIAREQELVMRQAAAAELTVDQNMLALMQQNNAAAAAAAELTRDPNVIMMLQQAVGGQQQQLDQYAAMGHLNQQTVQQMASAQQLSAAARVAREQQQATAYAHAMPGSMSDATNMAFQPGGSTDAEAFLVQQPQTDSSLPPSLANLPQQNDGGQLGPSSVLTACTLPPLTPWLADVPRQRQNDGGDDDGQLPDLTAYFGIPGPNLPADGR